MFTKTIADTLDTIKLTADHFSSSFNTSIFEIASVILATTIVLFLTLILIPIQQCASTYSPSLLKYLRRDRLAITLMLFLIACLFFNISMFFVEPTKLLASLSAVLLLLCFICIIFMTYRIIKMLDPAEYLFPQIKDDCIRTIKHGLKNPRPLTVQEQQAQLEQQIKYVISTPEEIHPKDEKWAVPGEVIYEVLKKMAPLKTVSMKLISASDFEAFEKAIGSIRDISITYFNERRNYKNPDDDFMFSYVESLRDIVRTARHNPNVYFCRCVLQAIKDMALSTVLVNVYGSLTGRNDLAYAFSGVLNESAHITVIGMDRDRTFDAVANLGRVAEGLASRGVCMTAADIASDLAYIGKLCKVAGDTVTPVPLRRSLAEIFFLNLWNRRLFPYSEIAFKKLIETYEVMIDIPVPPGAALTHGNPIIDWNADLSKDRSLSTLVYAALFSPNHGDDILNYNLDVVLSIVHFIEKHHDKSIEIGMMYTNLLYQIGLWLFAFIDKEIQLELTMLPVGTIPSERNQKKAKSILADLIKYSLITYFKCVNKQTKNIVDTRNLLHASLSLLYLELHWDSKHSLYLNQEIESILGLLEDGIGKISERIDYNAYQSFQILCQFLNRLGQPERAKAIQQKVQAAWNTKYDTSSHGILHIIKRPIVTFNYNFISQLDTEIFEPENGQ